MNKLHSFLNVEMGEMSITKIRERQFTKFMNELQIPLNLGHVRNKLQKN